MNKNEYMEAIKSALAEYDAELGAEIIGEFENHFAEAKEAGMTEEEIIAGLGSVDEVTAAIKGMYGEPHSEKMPEPRNEIEIKAATEMNDQEKGLVTSEVDRIEIYGNLDSELVPGEGDGYWEYHKHKNNLFDSPFWRQFWGGREESEDGGIEVERNGNALVFTLPKNISGHLRIEVPGYVRSIKIDGDSSDLDAKGLSLDAFDGNLRYGDYIFENCHIGTVAILASSGDVEASGLFGDIRVQSNAGDIELENHQGPKLDIITNAGDVEISTTSPVVSVRTHAGDVDLKMGGHIENVDVNTMAGDVEFASESKDYTATIKTNAGDLKNKSGLPKRSKSESIVGGSWIIGEGAATVTISTSAGDIEVR